MRKEISKILYITAEKLFKQGRVLKVKSSKAEKIKRTTNLHIQGNTHTNPTYCLPKACHIK